MKRVVVVGRHLQLVDERAGPFLIMVLKGSFSGVGQRHHPAVRVGAVSGRAIDLGDRSSPFGATFHGGVDGLVLDSGPDDVKGAGCSSARVLGRCKGLE